MVERELRFPATERWGDVAGLYLRPSSARWLLVFGHGAGAGMRHRFMERTAALLAENDVATLRYQFPYVERGAKRPDAQPVLLDTVRAAVRTGEQLSDGLPMLAGGKSMGGRMTSLEASESGLPGVRGLVFFGFPLHAPGRPSVHRARHLETVELPMLFLQGTRDRLADLELLGPVCARLADRTTLHVVEGGDHSFHVLKRTGRTDDEVLEELASAVAKWADGL